MNRELKDELYTEFEKFSCNSLDPLVSVARRKYFRLGLRIVMTSWLIYCGLLLITSAVMGHEKILPIVSQFRIYPALSILGAIAVFAASLVFLSFMLFLALTRYPIQLIVCIMFVPALAIFILPLLFVIPPLLVAITLWSIACTLFRRPIIPRKITQGIAEYRASVDAVVNAFYAYLNGTYQHRFQDGEQIYVPTESTLRAAKDFLLTSSIGNPPVLFHYGASNRKSLAAEFARFERWETRGKRKYRADEILASIPFDLKIRGKIFIFPEKGDFRNRFSTLSVEGSHVALEDPHFEEEFHVTGTDQIEARKFLTPVVMERMQLFKRRLAKISGKSDINFRCCVIDSNFVFIAPSSLPLGEIPAWPQNISSNLMRRWFTALIELRESIDVFRFGERGFSYDDESRIDR